MDAFEAAKTSLLGSLSPEEAAMLSSHNTAAEVLAEVEKAEDEHRGKCNTRKYMKNIENFVKGVEQYGKALDVYVNAKPEVLSLIWGTARLVIHIAIEYIDFYEKLMDMFRQLGKSLGRFGVYARLYPTSDRLRCSLIGAYEKYLRLCILSRQLFVENKAKRLKWLPSSSTGGGIKVLWKPIKQKIETTLEELDELLDDVETEADVAEKVEAAEARNEITKIGSYISAERFRQIIDWLGPADPSINHQSAVKVHEPETGNWIFDNDIYKVWESESKATLWLHAKPGGGKTILASTIIDHVTERFHNDPKVIVTYFYCDHKDVSKKATAKVVQTLIADISRKSAEALAYVDEMSLKYREIKSPCTLDALLSILKKCLELQSKTFLIIDALDECEDRDELLNIVLELSNASPNLNLLLTSRKEQDIQRMLYDLPQVELADANMAGDIKIFVKARIDSMIKNKRLKLRDENLRHEIFDSLCSRADGMFQWVKCQLDALSVLITDKSIRAALLNLPTGLDETYTRAFAKIRTNVGDDIDMIKRLFWWLIHSVRPLTLHELSEAIGIEIGQTKMDFSAVASDPDDIISLCGGLVTISGRGADEKIHFSHFSIEEFLLSPRIKETPVAEFYAGPSTVRDAAATCLTYLMMDDFRGGQCLEETALRRREQKYAFLDYAVRHWAHHYKSTSAQASEVLEDLALEFLTNSKLAGNLENWLQISTQDPGWNSHLEPLLSLVAECTPMYHASRLGLPSLVVRLIKAGFDVDAESNTYSAKFKFPILAAAFHSHWDVVDVLLNAGASIHLHHDGSVLSAIAHAADPAAWDLLTRVLKIGGQRIVAESHFQEVRGLPQDILGAFALHPSDAWQMVELLIEYGAAVNGTFVWQEDETETAPHEHIEKGGPPLQLAAFQGNLRVMESLIRAGAWINFQFCELGSPLQAAVRGGRTEAILKLLEYGANVNGEGGALGTPLQAAAWKGNSEILNMLLDQGADVHATGGIYGSAMNAAIRQKHTEIAQTLLAKGSDLNTFYDAKNVHWELYSTKERVRTRVRHCDTPLQNAIASEDLSMVKMLLAAGARTSQSDGRCNEGTSTHSLCLAATLGNVEMVNLLLQNGADPAVGNCCAVVLAAWSSQYSIFKLLCDRVNFQSPDIALVVCDIVSKTSDDAIAQEVIRRLEDVVTLSPGVSEEAGDLVSATVQHDNFTLTQFLLEKGFTPNLEGSPNERRPRPYVCAVPLPMAIGRRQFDLANLLLDHGADPNIVDGRWGAPIHVAVVVQNLELVTKLLELGAEPEGDVPWGGSCSKVVHIAATHQNPTILKELLRRGANPDTPCHRCPSAFMAAVSAQNVETMEFLVSRGADVGAPDAFGRLPISRARDNHLELATERLLKDNARESLSKAEVQSCLEATVNNLSLMLQEQQWFLSFAHRNLEDWVDVQIKGALWLRLGRSLILGGDHENGMIALEQTCSKAPDDVPLKYENQIACRYCFSVFDKVFHLCEDCSEGMFCDDCTERHRILYRDSAFGHKVTDFPRNTLSDVPEGQVGLGDGSRTSVDEWLQSLHHHWKATR